jgi:hypothetical protein
MTRRARTRRTPVVIDFSTDAATTLSGSAADVRNETCFAAGRSTDHWALSSVVLGHMAAGGGTAGAGGRAAGAVGA